MSACLTRPRPRDVQRMVEDVRPAATGARCQRPHGHQGDHQATVRREHGGRAVLVGIRWPR